MGNFPRELGNSPDVGELGEFPWKFSQEKEVGNFPNSLRESEGVYLNFFGNFTPHGNLGNFPRELGNSPDVWEFGEFPWKISQEKDFGNFSNTLRESEGSIF